MPMNIQGREHWQVDELLDLAHQRGLLSIETELIEAPSEANGHTTICHARVTLVGADGNHRVFTGLGDANARNTNKAIGLHAPRMSETRAIGRALRIALNVKGASFEELDTEAATGAVHTTTSREAHAAPAQAEGLATQVEIGRLWGAMKGFYKTEEAAKTEGRKYLAENFGGKTSTKELTSAECQAATKAFLEATQASA